MGENPCGESYKAHRFRLCVTNVYICLGFFKRFGILDLPKPDMERETWHVFNGYEEGDTGYLKIFSKLKEDSIVQSVIFAAWRDKTYSIYFRETDYSCLECLIDTALEFVKHLKRNPKNLLELDAFEMYTHGASGMDDTHRDIKSMEDVKQLLKVKYDIEM